MHINSIFALLTKCEIKTAFFCVFMDQDKVKVSKKCKKKTQKKEQGKNPTILTKEAWSVEDLLICMAKRIFLLVGHMQKILSIHDRPILSVPFILPACKSSHSTIIFIIINIILCTDYVQ